MKIKQIVFLIIISLALVAAAQAQTDIQTPPVLSEAQLAKLKEIRETSAKKIAPVALKFAGVVKQIYDNMLADKEDQTLRKKLSRQMDKLGAELFAVKGQSIRDMLGILTAEQKQFVKNAMQKPGAKGDLGEMIESIFNLPKI